MNSIYRISVPVDDYQELSLTGPILSVAADRGGSSDVIDLWYEHMDGNRPAYKPNYHRPRSLWIFGTGHPVPWTDYTRHAWHFLGTVVTPSGLIWHCYTGHMKGKMIGV
jgi:hypothetical protein